MVTILMFASGPQPPRQASVPEDKDRVLEKIDDKDLTLGPIRCGWMLMGGFHSVLADVQTNVNICSLLNLMLYASSCKYYAALVYTLCPAFGLHANTDPLQTLSSSEEGRHT